MVYGLKHFTESLSSFKEHYILVGGVAGDLLMTDIGGEFRATRDLDIVVFMKPDPTFLKALAGYIKDGEYENKEKSSGVNQYYRFNKPKKTDFPKQIELFSKKPEDLKLFEDQHVVPLHAIDIGDQFSGILLEDEYYDLIKSNAVDGEHCRYISAVAQIPLKARAFNELKERQAKGASIDSSDIKKHRNDILLLSQALPVGESFKLSGLPLDHVKAYLSQMSAFTNDAGVVGYCRDKKLGSLEILLKSISDFYI